MPGFNSVQQLETPDYTGYYIGTVVANDDPKKQQRVKVSIPELLEGAAAMLPWVAPIQNSPFGYTATAGVVAVPVVGSTVVVEFQNGELYYGLIQGCIPTSAFTIPAELAVNYPARRGWKDPAGNLFWIDTTSGSVDVTFKHTSGTTVNIDKDGNVKIDSVAKVTVNATSGIEMTAPTLDVTANSTFTGNVAIVGLATISETLVVTGEVTGAGVKLSHHQHNGVRNGDSLTGPPQNF